MTHPANSSGQAVEPVPAYEYTAFITSRAGSEGEKLAHQLAAALEDFETPPPLAARGIARRMGRVFRCLPQSAAGSLTGAEREALWRSRYLIAVCTVEKPYCERVRAQIEQFKEWGRADRVLTLLAATSLNALIPAELQHWLAIGTGPDAIVEPVWVGDAQHAVTPAERNDLLRDRLAAVLLGCSFDEIRLYAEMYAGEAVVEYFEGQVRRGGAPAGIQPIPAANVKRRNRSLRFESRGGLVRRVTQVDGRGVAQNDPGGVAQWDMFYRPDGTVDAVEHRDASGQLKLKETLSHGGRAVDLVSGALLSGGAPMCTGPETCQKRPGAMARHLLSYNAGGFVASVHYTANGSVALARDASGHYGEVYERNHRGQVTLTGYLDCNGREISRPGRVANKLHTYGPNGRLTRIAFLGADGKPISGREGFATELLAYDRWGNIAARSYLDADGEPVLHRNGYARAAYDYDDTGNETGWACYGTDGEPVLCEDGYARRTYAYDAAGNEIERTYTGTRGEPVLCRDGYARATQVYDAKGNLTEWACYGKHGEPVLDIYGVARIALSYDAHGNVTEWAFYGTRGEPVPNAQGIARVTQSFDAQGSLCRMARFDVHGRAVGTAPASCGETRGFHNRH